MKQLEDRIKDRLEGYESRLPEGDLAEFKALLGKAPTKSERKVASLTWLVPVAIAAGLLLLLTFGFDAEPEQPEVTGRPHTVAGVIDPVIPDGHKTDIAVAPSPARSRNLSLAQVRVQAEDKEETNNPDVKEPADEQLEEHASDQQDYPVVFSDAETTINQNTPLRVSPDVTKRVSTKAGKYAAGVLGGTATLALASALPSVLGYDRYDDMIGSPGENQTSPPVDKRTWDDTHHMPLRIGLSLRLPFSERWSLTTGLDYTLYSSKIEYTISGKRRQSVHYLGVPVRMDYTLAHNRWLDIYLGTGASVDFCVDAHQEGSQVAKDGVGFSMVGVGGFQFNFTRHLGLYLEPTLSWNVPSDRRVLDTYKSEHPLMLSVSTGIRITLPNLSAKQ